MNKPEGSGWLESSVEDRYASMKPIPTDKSRGDHPDMKPVGEKAGVAYGYKPSSGATDK